MSDHQPWETRPAKLLLSAPVPLSTPVSNSLESKYLASIEGNVGCGKSSVLASLSKQDLKNYVIAEEPVEQWVNYGGTGTNLLKMAYEKKNMYLFQTFVLLTQAKVLKEKRGLAGANKFVLSERSLLSNRFCFTEIAYHANDITKIEYSILDDFYEYLAETTQCIPGLVIYLQTMPEVAYERILRRGRTAESKISLDYVKRLHDAHETWLFGNNAGLTVVTIDANDALEAVVKKVRSLLHEYKESVRR